MILKPFFYFLAVISIAVCVYAFVEGVTVMTVENPHAAEEVTSETEGPLKKAIDKNSTVLCEIESFWSKYNVWGDTDTVYGPAEHDEAVENKVDESIGCDEPLEDTVSQ